MINFSMQQFFQICGGATVTSPCYQYWGQLCAAMDQATINTPERIAAFMAQIIVESGTFSHVVENLNYSSDGLLKTFPKHFDANSAIEYAHNPEKIANRVYANRYGNGDESTGDGWRYRGRGLIQLTFKNNYVDFKNDSGIVNDPELNSIDIVKYMTTPEGIVRSATWFWTKNELNKLVDGNLFVDLTKKINGGTNGLAAREAIYSKALKILS